LDSQRKVNGVPFDKINSVLAVPACESAVRKYPNSVRLIYQLGRAYAKKNDFKSAFVQYQKAADQEYVLAEYNLGVLYEKGWGVAKDDAQAVAWYRKAAEQGMALAQFNLGNMYGKGQGVPQDYAEALRWLHKAADQGNAHALINLGVMYAEGRGVPQDYIEAVKFYRKGAEQGDAPAQTNLGSMYGLGNGVPQDYAEAAKWFRLAADQGYASAQYLLGLLYEDGDGVPKNIAEATDWYRKAATQGNDEARRKLVGLDADARAGRAAEEAGNAALRKALAAGKTIPQAWEEAALAAGRAASDEALVAGRTQEVARQVAQQATDQVRARAPKVAATPMTPATASQPFVVVIDVSVSGGARPTVTGRTNLPDGTELYTWLKKPWLPNAKERLAVGLPACEDDCFPLQTSSKLPDGVGLGVVVKNGHFSDGPFTDKGAALQPGEYVLEVSFYFATFQPANVRAIIGPLGENMTGPLVGGCCFGSHMNQAEIQTELEKQRSAAPTLGASIYYARYVTIGSD
jgi:TPR repeat protein